MDIPLQHAGVFQEWCNAGVVSWLPSDRCSSSQGVRLPQYMPNRLPLTNRYSLSRLQYLTESQDKPFYLTVAPVSPHVEIPGLPVPLARHANDFPGVKAPRDANFNPASKYTAQKPSWLKYLPLLNSSELDRADRHQRARLQALAGVDEIVQDVVDFLDKKNLLDNTYSKPGETERDMIAC